MPLPLSFDEIIFNFVRIQGIRSLCCCIVELSDCDLPMTPAMIAKIAPAMTNKTILDFSAGFCG